MAEILGYQFDRVFAEPIELYRKVDTISERDAIPTGKRYQGMLCYVVSENEDYQLRTGTTNGDWVASGVGNFFNKSTDDTDDITEGVTNLFMSTTEQTKLGYITVTQAIDLDQLEIDVAALGSGVTFKGVWSPSGGVFPGGGTSAIGDLYIADDSGTIDGISFVSGDGVISTVVNASTTVYASNWAKTESTSDVTSVVGLNGVITKTALLSALNVEDGATADMTDAEIVTAINNELTVTTWQNPLTKEQVLDYIGEAIAAGTQTNITVTYNDASDSIDFDVAPNLDAATLDGLDSTQFLRSDVSDTKTAGDLTFDDNVKIALGTAGAESEISSDATNTNINLKSGNLNIQDNGVDIALVNRTTGNVSIGNTNNTYKLDVTGTCRFGLNSATILEDDGLTSYLKGLANKVALFTSRDTDDILFFAGASSPLRAAINADTGNVSIGNANNTYKLDVSGTGRFTGDVIVPSDPYSADWNGDNSAAPKNDVYDEMETKITGSSGTYTPTAVTDVTFYDAFYQIIGNQCSLRVNFEFSTLPTGNPTTFSLSLPSGVTVASPVLNRLIGAGHGYSEANNILEYRIKEQASSSLLTVEIYSLEVDGTPSVMQFSVTTTIEIN